jgi:hypothetical protein
MALSAIEFVRRVVMHVLPAGFVRIRHYGLLANRQRREKLSLCRELLGAVAARAVAVADEDLVARPEDCDPVTPTRSCPVCGAGRLVVIAELPAPAPGRRGAVAGWGPNFDTS